MAGRLPASCSSSIRHHHEATASGKTVRFSGDVETAANSTVEADHEDDASRLSSAAGIDVAVDESGSVAQESATAPRSAPATRSSSSSSRAGRSKRKQPKFEWKLPASIPDADRRFIDTLRRQMQFFFMCPVSKWRTRRQTPFKLVLQLFKVVLVSIQLCVFANRRFSFVGYMSDTQVILEHVLLPGWDPSREINAYPPNTGPLAVYTKLRLFETLDNVVNNYYNIEEQVLADISYPNNTGALSTLCVESYNCESVPYKENRRSGQLTGRAAVIRPLKQTPLVVKCINLQPSRTELLAHNFSTRLYLQQHQFTLDFVDILSMRLSLSLRGIHRKILATFDVPQCYRLNATVLLLNSMQDGQFNVHLRVIPENMQCVSTADDPVASQRDMLILQVLFTVLNSVVILICAASFVMCVRSILRALSLRTAVEHVLLLRFDYRMTSSERRRFCQLWYFCIVVNDCLIILGSSIKIKLDNLAVDEVYNSHMWNLCSVALGVGTFLVWMGILRYLSFFHEYNILILTVKGSIPTVLRFSVCAAIAYAGFALCGWMVLSPYHMKFRSFMETSEALFSLMNGDDMFATFAEVSHHSPLVYWFSKVYIYLFVCSFIYLVLSLMISIIMDTFDTIKVYYREGFPRSPLDDFCSTRFCEPDESSPEGESNLAVYPSFSWMRCCCCNCWSDTSSQQDWAQSPDDVDSGNTVTDTQPLL